MPDPFSLLVYTDVDEGDAPRVTSEGVPAVENPIAPPFRGAFGRGA